MSQESNRLIMRFEHLMRSVNREVINPEIEEVSIESLRPMVNLVARCRAEYLKTLYELSHKYDGSNNYPSDEEMQRLKKLRERFLDLSDGAKSFEICIQRGYIDIKE